MVARCPTCTDVPGEDCTADPYRRHRHGCGIHAGNDRPHVRVLGYDDAAAVAAIWPEHDIGVVAIGEVGLAGKVIVGAKGWRATRARPLRLYVPYGAWRLVKPLRDAYGVPVQLANLTGAPP